MRTISSTTMKQAILGPRLQNKKQPRDTGSGVSVVLIGQNRVMDDAHRRYLHNALQVSHNNSIDVDEFDALFRSKKIIKKDVLDVLYKASNVLLDSEERALYNDVLLYDLFGKKCELSGFDKKGVVIMPDQIKVVPSTNPKTRIKASTSVNNFDIDASFITLYGNKRAVLSSAPSRYDRDYGNSVRQGAKVTKIYSVHSKPTANTKACVYENMQYEHLPIGPVWRGFHHPLAYKAKENAFKAYKNVAQDIYDGKTIAIHCHGGKDRSAITLFAGACASFYAEVKGALLSKSEEDIKRILYTEFLKIHMKMRVQRSPETHRNYMESIKFIHDFVEQVLLEKRG